VVDGDSDEGDCIQHFVSEDKNSYKGRRENFTSCVGPPQGAVKRVTEIVDVFELFLTENLIDTIVAETSR
jgi:hypothetical protein